MKTARQTGSPTSRVRPKDAAAIACPDRTTASAEDLLELRAVPVLTRLAADASIAERTKLPTSVMPEGLAANLTLGQFASLIDYVESLAVASGADVPRPPR